MDKKLKRELNRIQIPPYREAALSDTIAKAKKIRFQPAKYRMTDWQFFRDQIRFIQKKTWIMKLAFTMAALFLLGTGSGSPQNWVWPLIAVFGPLLCLINANEIYGAFCPGLLELQMTTHYTAKKIVLVRLAFFGLCDLLLLTAVSFWSMGGYGNGFWQALLYGTVPYNLMCVGCMLIFRYCHEENAQNYCAGLGIGMNGAVVAAKVSGINLYAEGLILAWLLLEIAVMAGIRIAFQKWMGKVNGNVNELNVGSPV